MTEAPHTATYGEECKAAQFALDEIERCKQHGYYDPVQGLEGVLRAFLTLSEKASTTRNEIIEECAMVCGSMLLDDAAEAIRALKNAAPQVAPRSDPAQDQTPAVAAPSSALSAELEPTAWLIERPDGEPPQLLLTRSIAESSVQRNGGRLTPLYKSLPSATAASNGPSQDLIDAQECLRDIFHEFDESEVKKMTAVIRNAWRMGQHIVNSSDRSSQ